MTEALFILGGIFLWAALHPFTTYPLSLVLIRRWRRAPAIGTASPDHPETFAICFCAYNEERVIDAKMRNLLELRRALPGLEILAYVDAATDRTAERLRRYANQITLHISPERLGKTHGMNLLAERTTASIIVFTDANVMLDGAALANLRRYFADPRIGCVCGHLLYVNPRQSVTAGNGSLYWRLEEWIKQLETETGSAMGADGSLFAIRRSLRRRVPDDIIDDMFVSLAALRDGYRVVRAPDVMAYEETVTEASEEFRRKIRIACQAFNVHRLLWPDLRRLGPLTVYKYLSHKLLRWLSIYSLLSSCLCGEAALMLAGLTPAAVEMTTLGGLALLVGKNWAVRPFAQIWDIFNALLATGIGVWLSFRGEQFRTWTPAASIRG